MKSLKEWQSQDMAAIVKAIEADAGKRVTGLRTALKQAQAGKFAEVHTPEKIAARKRGRPVGTVKIEAKVPTTIRMDADVLQVFKASGRGWQTRVNDVLREVVISGNAVNGEDAAALIAKAKPRARPATR